MSDLVIQAPDGPLRLSLRDLEPILRAAEKAGRRFIVGESPRERRRRECVATTKMLRQEKPR